MRLVLRRNLALAAAFGIVGTLTGVPTPLAAQSDKFSKAEAFVIAVYPELTKPGQFFVWFQTDLMPLAPPPADHSDRPFNIRVAAVKDVEAAHHHHMPLDALLVADVRFDKAGEIREFMAQGSRYAHADRTAALHRELEKQVEMTDEAVLQAFRTAEMRFLPGQRDRLLTHIRPVIAEMERHFGKLEIDSIEEPRREIQQYPNGPRPNSVLSWSVRASTQTGAARRELSMVFEPYDGRLIILFVR